MASQPCLGTVLGARAHSNVLLGRSSFWRWESELVGEIRAYQRRCVVLFGSMLADGARSPVVGHTARFALGSPEPPADHRRGDVPPRQSQLSERETRDRLCVFQFSGDPNPKGVGCSSVPLRPVNQTTGNGTGWTFSRSSNQPLPARRPVTPAGLGLLNHAAPLWWRARTMGTCRHEPRRCALLRRRPSANLSRSRLHWSLRCVAWRSSVTSP